LPRKPTCKEDFDYFQSVVMAADLHDAPGLGEAPADNVYKREQANRAGDNPSTRGVLSTKKRSGLAA
jgi:hypothetical protein